MRKILSAQKCPYCAYIESLGLIGNDARNYKLASIIKEYMTTNKLSDLADVNFNKSNLLPLFKDIDFTLDKEREDIENTYVNNISFIAKELDNIYDVIETNVNTKIVVNKKDIFLKYDLILQKKNTNEFFAVTIHSGKGTYTNTEKYEGLSFEWYVRLKLAEELNQKYPGIRPGKLHLKTNSTRSMLSNHLIIPEIDRTIIKNRFDKELTDSTNIKINKNSCKNPDYQRCQDCPAKNLCEFFVTNTQELNKIVREKVTSKTLRLTDAQESLMNSNKGIYRVPAGAGTGKTTTLANKIVAMIQDDIKPEDILVITFTEKGIQEIKEKIDYWLNEWFITEISSKDFPIYTFNGYGDIVIKENYQRFGFTKEPTLIDSVEKIELIKDILNKFPRIENFRYDNPLLKMYRAYGAVYQFQQIVEEFKKVSENPAEFNAFIDKIKNTYQNSYNDLMSMIDYYNKYLMDNNLIEYEDQTNALVKLCQVGYEDLFQKYGKDIVICDEFQDTDKKQLLFIRNCASRPTFHSLTMVGDDSQSIFGWRGANREIFINLGDYFNNLKDIKMLENFRSTQPIIDLANKVNNLSEDKFKKDLVGAKAGKPVELIDTTGDGTTEAIIKKVKSLLAQGEEKYNIGVIARTKQQLQEINQRFQEEKIPCLVSVHEFLVENPKVKNIIGLPEFLMDTEKTLYLAEFLQAKDPVTFDAQTDIGVYTAEEAKRIKEELEELKSNSTNYDLDLVAYFYNMLDELDENDKAFLKLKDILKNKTFNNLGEINSFLSRLKAYDADFGVEKDEEAYDAITLMTPHSAKGREFKIILVDLERFKTLQAEDLRCLFVAITRAMEELYIYEDVSLNRNDSYFNTIADLLK